MADRERRDSRRQGDISTREETTGHEKMSYGGTPQFMSPEQWENSHDIDARADLYALGCTLYYLLVGNAPYGAETHRSLPQKMAMTPASPSGSWRGP